MPLWRHHETISRLLGAAENPAHPFVYLFRRTPKPATGNFETVPWWYEIVIECSLRPKDQ